MSTSTGGGTASRSYTIPANTGYCIIHGSASSASAFSTSKVTINGSDVASQTSSWGTTSASYSKVIKVEDATTISVSANVNGNYDGKTATATLVIVSVSIES